MDEQYVLTRLINLDHAYSISGSLLLNDVILNNNPDDIVKVICDIETVRNNSLASCDCGELSCNFHIGTKCRSCDSICRSSVEVNITNDRWIRIPNSIKAVLSPGAYFSFRNWMGDTKRQSVLDLILNDGPVEQIKGTPFFSGQGFNWFYDNFETVINHFVKNHHTKTGKALSKWVPLYLEAVGDNIWCKYLPILSSIIQPITQVNDEVRYVDKELRSLMKAIFTIKSCLLSEMLSKNVNVRRVEKNFYPVYNQLMIYYDTIRVDMLPKKDDLLRKHIYGSRSHCTGRSVVSPIIKPHDYDEIHLPWKIGIMMYKYHIISILKNKYGMKVMQANNKVMNAINIYDRDIDVIMTSMIEQCRFKGLPVLFNRNPSLKVTNINLLFVTHIKPGLSDKEFKQLIQSKDNKTISIDTASDIFFAETEDKVTTLLNRLVDDGTISVSWMIAPGLNLDFDGDEGNIMPIFEMGAVKKLMNVHPSIQFLSRNNLDITGTSIMLSAQQICMVNNFLDDEDYK